MYQKVFKRYEIKYLLNKEQKGLVLEEIKKYMDLDQYGRTIIRNLYFDTSNYLLIRRSIEKPLYKEKIRIRTYKKASSDSEVFVEIKKKYDHIVYKRRVALKLVNALNWLDDKEECAKKNQIVNEIEYFKSFYKELKPAMFLSYEREAYYDKVDKTFRVTFDEKLKARNYDLSLEKDAYGIELLEGDKVLMEIKCNGGIPLWLVNVLSREKIYRTSFSKYGKAYEKLIFDDLKFKVNNKEER